MAKKENRGGNLSNEQIEEELARKEQTTGEVHGYQGAQDTGDDKVRSLGTPVQKRDGFLEEEEGEGKDKK
jgi:hypothetical protein